MSDDGQSQKKRLVKKGNEDDLPPIECERDTDSENIAKDTMEAIKRSSPRRKYLRETAGVIEKIDEKEKSQGDDDSSEEVEAGNEVKSKPSKSEDEEYVSDPPAKKRKLVKSVQENVSGEENPQGKKSKAAGKGRKGVKRAKRLTLKKSKSSKKKAKIEQDESEYEVEEIVKVRILKNGKKEFLIRWKGYSAEHDTWEPEVNLTCKELVNQYFEEHKEEIEAPAEEEEKKNKKGKSKRRGSPKKSRPKQTDSAADEEDSAGGNAKKRKVSSKKSRGKINKKQTRARKAGAKSGKDEAPVTDSEEGGDAKTKKTEKDEGKDTPQSTGGSPVAEESGERPGTSESGVKGKDFQVEKVIDVRELEEGDREFLVKWRGYPHQFNTWEPENNIMNCSEKIEKFLKSMEQNTSERELRVVRKKTNRFVPDDGGRGRKPSVRLGNMPRKSYSELD